MKHSQDGPKMGPRKLESARTAWWRHSKCCKNVTSCILASLRSSNMCSSMLDGSLACVNAFLFGLIAGIETSILVADKVAPYRWHNNITHICDLCKEYGFLNSNCQCKSFGSQCGVNFISNLNEWTRDGHMIGCMDGSM